MFFKKKKIKSTLNVSLKEQSTESTVLDDLQSILDRMDNLKSFTLISLSDYYTFVRNNKGKWYCSERDYSALESHSIKEIIEYVEKGGERKPLPILIKK